MLPQQNKARTSQNNQTDQFLLIAPLACQVVPRKPKHSYVWNDLYSSIICTYKTTLDMKNVDSHGLQLDWIKTENTWFKGFMGVFFLEVKKKKNKHIGIFLMFNSFGVLAVLVVLKDFNIRFLWIKRHGDGNRHTASPPSSVSKAQIKLCMSQISTQNIILKRLKREWKEFDLCFLHKQIGAHLRCYALARLWRKSI